MFKRCGKTVVALIWLALLPCSLLAQVLPEDRFDAMYHSYDGDQVKITGPSILLRKQVSKNASVFANYYVDDITSASIDVRTLGASEYTEKRTEISFGGDVLIGDSIVSAGYVNSDENDFKAETAWFNVSQEVFGGLTTVKLGLWSRLGRNQGCY